MQKLASKRFLEEKEKKIRIFMINEFFLGYRYGWCISQPVGNNIFRSPPLKIAQYFGFVNAGAFLDVKNADSDNANARETEKVICCTRIC